MIKIGLPAGIQGCLFSLSNVLIQSSINSFGPQVMTANTIAAQLDGFIFTSMNAISLSAMAFVSQNYGANNYDRIKKTILCALCVTTIVGIVVGGFIILIAPIFFGIVADEQVVIDIAYKRILIIASTYFTCGIMDAMSYILRGLGRSTLAMVVTLVGTCLFRIIWINTVFVFFYDLNVLYLVYPASYLLSITMFTVAYVPIMKSVKKQIRKRKEELLKDSV